MHNDFDCIIIYFKVIEMSKPLLKPKAYHCDTIMIFF